jgi:hypothetical protein
MAPFLLHAAGDKRKRPWSVWWPTANVRVAPGSMRRGLRIARWYAVPYTMLRPTRSAKAVPARSPMSASWPATKAAACGRETFSLADATVYLAGDRTDYYPLHAAVLIATLRCAAPARCGGFADERRVLVGDEGERVPHRRACAFLAASFAAGVRELALERITPSHAGALIATLHRAAPACCAFVDERRVVVGDAGAKSAV